MQIRTVREGDAPVLADLLNQIIARGGTTAFQTPFSAEALADALLTGPEVVCCFVAEDDDGELHGFQSLVRSNDLPGDVGDIATFSRVDAVQRGTGSRLLASTVRAAEANGLVAINATIRADNSGGLAFYARMGFLDHGVHRAVPLADGTSVDRIEKRYRLGATAPTTSPRDRR